MEIGKIGIWSFLDMLPAAEAQEVAREIEDLGFSALWIPEAVGREVFTSSGILLAGTKRLVVATGIANVWADELSHLRVPEELAASGASRSRAPIPKGAFWTARAPPPV